MKNWLYLLFSLITQFGFSQVFENGDFKFSGYVEAYYSYDFNQPDNQNRPNFLYNFARHNELSINLALIKMAYSTEGVRANLALMAGTYAQLNMAEEPVWAQFVNEASVGVKLMEDLWLDVGIMPSHIGFESWIGVEGWHLSRSLLAENSPYFLSGARLSYDLRENLTLILWATNGWQNVQRVDRSRGIGLGFGVNHRPTQFLEINYANYFGNEGLDPVRQLRFFNNFYTQYDNGNWGITLGTDYGLQEAYFGNANQWFGLTASLRKSICGSFYLAGRAEYFSDTAGVILEDGLKVSGISLNLDYHYLHNTVFRLECRQFISPTAPFSLPGGRFSNGNTAITGSFSVKF